VLSKVKIDSYYMANAETFSVNVELVGDQSYPNITALSSGRFVVTWTERNGSLRNSDTSLWISSSDIKAQVFGADGVKVGNVFLVNTEVAGPQELSSIAALGSGGFVVTWSDFQSGTLGDTSYGSIKAQIFDADGVKVGSEFLVNTITANTQVHSQIAPLIHGGFIVTWQDASGGANVKAQVFGADGTKVGNEFLVNTKTDNHQLFPSVASLGNGGFVVTWEDYSGKDTSYPDIKAQIFDANAVKVGNEFLVNTKTFKYQIRPSVKGLGGDSFIVTWQDFSSTDNVNLKAQIFSSNGTKLGGEFFANTHKDIREGTDIFALADGGVTTSPQVFGPANTKVVGLNSGGFAATWVDRDFRDSVKVKIFSLRDQPYAGTDIFAGDDLLIVKKGAGDIDGQGGSDIYVITGSAEHQAAAINDSGMSGVDEVRFSAAKAGSLRIFEGDAGLERVVIGTGTGAVADSSGTTHLNIDASEALNSLIIIGNAGENWLRGTAFADTIDGGAGADKLWGGAGNDTYIVDNDKDAITEKADGGTDTVMASVAYSLAANVENLTLTGSNNINGTGNSLANTITGNEGNNILAGGTGSDALDGGIGNDTLLGGLGNDTLTGGAGGDIFLFDTKPNAATNSDTITDFSHSDGDHLQFSLKSFTGLGSVGDISMDQFWSGAGVTAAHDATDRIIYNTTTGDLFYDADGSGKRSAAVLVAHLDSHPALIYSDIQIIG